MVYGLVCLHNEWSSSFDKVVYAFEMKDKREFLINSTALYQLPLTLFRAFPLDEGFVVAARRPDSDGRGDCGGRGRGGGGSGGRATANTPTFCLVSDFPFASELRAVSLSPTATNVG